MHLFYWKYFGFQPMIKVFWWVDSQILSPCLNRFFFIPLHCFPSPVMTHYWQKTKIVKIAVSVCIKSISGVNMRWERDGHIQNAFLRNAAMLCTPRWLTVNSRAFALCLESCFLSIMLLYRPFGWCKLRCQRLCDTVLDLHSWVVQGFCILHRSVIMW